MRPTRRPTCTLSAHETVVGCLIQIMDCHSDRHSIHASRDGLERSVCAIKHVGRRKTLGTIPIAVALRPNAFGEVGSYLRFHCTSIANQSFCCEQNGLERANTWRCVSNCGWGNRDERTRICLLSIRLYLRVQLAICRGTTRSSVHREICASGATLKVLQRCCCIVSSRHKGFFLALAIPRALPYPFS